MSSPLSMTLPALGARSPESRLMSVDLPAPFGPITAWTFPMWHSTETSLTAVRPPKRRVRPCVARIARSVMGALAPQGGREPRESARQEQRGEHDEQAHEQLPVLAQVDLADARQSLQSELEQHPDRRAERRAEQRAHAAEDHHHHHRRRLVPAHHLGIDDAELHRGEVARDARDRAGYDEAYELVPERRIAEGQHARLVDPDAGEDAAERGAQH